MSATAARSGPDRILFIRHAEQHETTGFTEEGIRDDQSLTVRGWQRAGALARRFAAFDAAGIEPNAVFASGLGPESPSRRPQQTVAPLVALLRASGGEVETCFSFLKPDAKGLMAEVLGRSGTVLVAWEHSVIPDCVEGLPNAPPHPEKWPDERYDLIWRLERDDDGWRFTEEAQAVLAGDRPV